MLGCVFVGSGIRQNISLDTNLSGRRQSKQGPSNRGGVDAFFETVSRSGGATQAGCRKDFGANSGECSPSERRGRASQGGNCRVLALQSGTLVAESYGSIVALGTCLVALVDEFTKSINSVMPLVHVYVDDFMENLALSKTWPLQAAVWLCPCMAAGWRLQFCGLQAAVYITVPSAACCSVSQGAASTF
jgi:hypothetical protein